MAPPEKKAIGLGEALGEIDKIQMLVAQMAAIFGKAGTGTDLVAETRRSLCVVRAGLESRHGAKPGNGSENMVTLMGSPCSDHGMSDVSTARGKRTGGAADKRGTRKGRSQSCSPITVTRSDTLVDGHPWRKYGKKVIQSSNFPKSYYRCTHKYTRNCLAIRQAQQEEDDPSIYTITYIGEHTCKNASSKPTHQPNCDLPAAAAKASSGRVGLAGDVAAKPESSLSPSFETRSKEIQPLPGMSPDTTPCEEMPSEYWPDMDLLDMTSLPMTTNSSDVDGGSAVGDVALVQHPECLDYMNEEPFDILSLYFDGSTE